MWEKVKKLFAPSDMTVGTPWKKIVAFMIPMLIGNIAQQMYNTVDSIVVGRYVGDNALAAVGSAGPIFQLLLVLFAGIAVGAGIMVSQYFGAKARDELSDEHCAGHLLRERSADGRQRRCAGHRNRADLFGDSLSDPSDEDARYL